MLMAEDQNHVVNDAIAAKEKVEAEIAAEKAKRKEMRKKLDELRDQEDEVFMVLDNHEKEIDALQPKIDAIEEEIATKESEFTVAEREYNDNKQFRDIKTEQEEEAKEYARRAQFGLLDENTGRKSDKSSRSGKSKLGAMFAGMMQMRNSQLESETNLDADKQKIPKVTRNLPHVR